MCGSGVERKKIKCRAQGISELEPVSLDIKMRNEIKMVWMC